MIDMMLKTMQGGNRMDSTEQEIKKIGKEFEEALRGIGIEEIKDIQIPVRKKGRGLLGRKMILLVHQ